MLDLAAASLAADFKNTDFEKEKGKYGLDDIVFTPEDEEKLRVEFKFLDGEAEKKIEELIRKRREEGAQLN